MRLSYVSGIPEAGAGREAATGIRSPVAVAAASPSAALPGPGCRDDA